MNIPQIIKLISDDFFLLNDSKDIEMFLSDMSVDKNSIQNKSLLYPPTNRKTISKKEKSLGVKLPPSYKEFLLASNGFRIVSPFLNNLFPIEKIDWAKNLEEKWSIDMFNNDPLEVSDEEYFYYEDDQDSVLSRTRYISDSLKVSEWYEGMCVFLNPVIKFGEEWEVLEYASWFPGIRRYKSFRDYLLKTHLLNQRLLRNRNQNNIS